MPIVRVDQAVLDFAQRSAREFEGAGKFGWTKAIETLPLVSTRRRDRVSI